MFRRSNSNSNIPLFKTNLFGSKDAKASKIGRRSQSCSRLSQRESVTSIPQLRPQRKSSLDRKSSNIGVKATPLAGRGSSLRTTPSSAIGLRAVNSRGTTPSSCLKDHITIQKLSTDKRWVMEQYAKVQNFILTSGLFDLSVVNEANIRPPSINNFIYITGVLLMEIFPKLRINKENYKEVIIAQLKVLKYPGSLANSVLKTVNTMHSWPQIVGMWSWLIDKVNLSRGSDDSFIDNLEPEQRRDYLLKENCIEFLVMRYNLFNKNRDCSEEIEKTNKDYLKSLTDILEVDFEHFKKLQEDVQMKTEYKNKQLQEIEDLKAENLKMETEMEEMNREIEEFHETNPIKESEVHEEMELLESNLRKMREDLAVAKENVAQLREAIKMQPCTYQEKLELLRQIEYLKEEIEVKRGRIEHAREIKNKFDHELAADINEIQSLVIQWNRSLMELSIKKPLLKKLMLREKGFHHPSFLDELQDVLHYKESVESEIADALLKVENDLKEETQKKLKLEKEIDEMQAVIHRFNADCAVAGEKITELKMAIEKVEKDLEEAKSSYTQQIKEFQKTDVIDNQIKTIAVLQKQRDDLKREVKNFGPKMLSFFVEMHNQVVTNLKEMEGIKRSLVEKIRKRQTSAIEKQEQIIETLTKFPKV